MLLAGSTRYLSSFTKQRMASLFRAVPPTLPYLHNTVASSVLFHTELTPDKFPAYGCMHHNLRGNPIPRTDKRNPLRLNTGQEYTSQHKARKPLSLLASMYEFGCAGPSQALPAPLRSNRAPSVERRFRFRFPTPHPTHSTQLPIRQLHLLYTFFNSPDRAKHKEVRSCSRPYRK